MMAPLMAPAAFGGVIAWLLETHVRWKRAPWTPAEVNFLKGKSSAGDIGL
jgi:hypothetical protein